MANKVFRVSGSYRVTHHVQNFTNEVVATSAEDARERLLSQIGSRHGVPRRLITVGEVVEVPLDDVTDPVVEYRAKH